MSIDTPSWFRSDREGEETVERCVHVSKPDHGPKGERCSRRATFDSDLCREHKREVINSHRIGQRKGTPADPEPWRFRRRADESAWRSQKRALGTGIGYLWSDQDESVEELEEARPAPEHVCEVELSKGGGKCQRIQKHADITNTKARRARPRPRPWRRQPMTDQPPAWLESLLSEIETLESEIEEIEADRKAREKARRDRRARRNRRYGEALVHLLGELEVKVNSLRRGLANKGGRSQQIGVSERDQTVLDAEQRAVEMEREVFDR